MCTYTSIVLIKSIQTAAEAESTQEPHKGGNASAIVRTSPDSGGSKEVRIKVVICGLLAVLLAVLLGLSIAEDARAFSDVSPDRLDYVAVTGLAMKGAVQGFPDGSFRPEAPVLRAQFVKMLAVALFLPLGSSDWMPFRDLDNPVSGALYPSSYVAAAYKAGIVEGRSTTVFQPFAPLTRAEAMTIAARAAKKLRAREFRPLPKDFGGWFAGYNDPVHGNNAKLAEANHLLAGIDLHFFDPSTPATRSEAARIAWNLVNCFG